MNKKRFTAFVLTLMTLMMLMCGAARAKETVRVGYFAFSGYHEMAEDGSIGAADPVTRVEMARIFGYLFDAVYSY